MEETLCQTKKALLQRENPLDRMKKPPCQGEMTLYQQ
jgi:hypothetical protein